MIQVVNNFFLFKIEHILGRLDVLTKEMIHFRIYEFFLSCTQNVCFFIVTPCTFFNITRKEKTSIYFKHTEIVNHVHNIMFRQSHYLKATFKSRVSLRRILVRHSSKCLLFIILLNAKKGGKTET